MPFLQVVVVGVVVEHRDKLVEAMRMAGLKPLSYWAATFVSEALLIGFGSALLVAGVTFNGLFNAAGHRPPVADDRGPVRAGRPGRRPRVLQRHGRQGGREV